MTTAIKDVVVEIGGSKSETNRLLLLQALYPEVKISNLSESDDSIAMRNALSSSESVIDVGHAGTAMRFLTAYFAISAKKPITLTGSARMQNRPVKILVDALKSLGANIEYTGKPGFPPIRILSAGLSDHVIVDAGTSSQFISALMLIAPKLENGLQIELTGDITSEPYIKMTASLLKKAGVLCEFSGNTISIACAERLPDNEIVVESDWSSASYYFGIAALSPIGTSIKLSNFSDCSVQGDKALMEIYKIFGVQSSINNSILEIRKESDSEKAVELNLSDTPDLAQTIAVTAFGLGAYCHLTGLQTLKIKETDRIAAIQNELIRLGADVESDQDSISIKPQLSISAGEPVETYGDHRMAMAFAQLGAIFPITIKDKEVVSKSYPGFWQDLETIGFSIADM